MALEIKVDQHGKGSVIIDGMDIGSYVKELVIEMKPGEGPYVELALSLPTEAEIKEIDVKAFTLNFETTWLLRKLGWKAPNDPE